MKILGIDFGSNEQFKITDEDRLWVEENFRWLITVFGYPNRMEEQVLLTEKFFPKTFSGSEITAENVIDDLCKLFSIPRASVRYELLKDLRDYSNVPYEIEGRPFECETDLIRGQYTIFIANSLLKNPDRLIYSLIYEFIRIRLTESELEYDVGGDDTSLFIYMAGIYYGFGVILAQNLLHAGQSNDGMWQIKWNYGSQMPQQVMAFALATYANLRGETDPAWKNEFKGDFKKMFDKALVYLASNPNDLYDEIEVKSNELFNQANEYFDNHRLDDAISTLQKILFLTSDPHMQADVYNNMGYYYMRTKSYQLGISNFRKALALGPAYGFANDNLGYALIMTGEYEEGKSYIDKAIATGNNDPAYTYRNLALYYQHTNQPAQAKQYFLQAFNEASAVDLLEYHYGLFLLDQGDVAEGKEYLKKSASKGEQEGKDKLEELGLI